MNIRLRITIVLLVMINLAIMIPGFFIYQNTGEIIQGVIEKNVKEMLESEKRTVELLLNQEIVRPYYLTREESVIKLLLNSNSEEAKETVSILLDEYISKYSDLEAVFLVDNKGIIIADVNQSMIGADLSEREYHQRTIQEQRRVIGKTVTSKNTGKQVFMLTNLIIDKTGKEMLGYICVAVVAESMADSLKNIKLNNKDASYACIVDENGNYIYHPIQDKIRKPVEIKEIEQIVSKVNNGEIVATSLSNYQTDEEQMIMAYSVIDEANWVLFVTGSMCSVMVENRQFTYFVVFFEFVIIIAASAITFFITKKITDPIITRLKSNNEELSALYEEVTASEEELHSQLEEIQLSKAQLELSEAKYRTILDNSSDIIYSCECDETIIAVNEAFCKYYHSAKLPVGVNVREFMKGAQLEVFWKEAFDKVISTHQSVSMDYNETVDNELRYFVEVLSPIEDSNHSMVGVMGTKRDITISKLNEAKIMEMAYHDALTHLPNRVLFFEELHNAIIQCESDHAKLAVAFLDLDNFKQINDTLGHIVGDELLVEISNRLREIVQRWDILARLSGDEFALLVKNYQEQSELIELMEEIYHKFKEVFILRGIAINISFSIGLAVYPHNGNNVEELMKNADTAMYKAKESGKNNYKFFDHFMN